MEVMGLLSLALMGIGFIMGFIGGIWLLIIGFQKHILWGLGMIFFPVLGWVFVAMHFEDSKNAFFLNLDGFALIILGAVLGGGLRG